ncbi:MAG: DUF1223 domain-containing protein [Hyphomicrobiales bacterium]|nr:DUF1223 domain-containing protein [Hyphomicrobiales bacterium]MBV9430675.1 DUF1223 domain-containing protein [Hyphomicrobiales bacterium]
MRTACLSSLIVVGLMSLLQGQAAAEPARKVVELFTSQGCNSCPPADRLAAELARDPGNVLISLPVDYWDYLGWKDSYAKPVFTARQKAYARARGDMQVYTPQAVVDGVTHAVGSDNEAIDTAVSAPLAVPVTGTISGDQLHVDVAASSGKTKDAQVWLVPIISAASVAIGRGENAGATVTYTNIARDLRKLGDWKGEARKFDVATADIRKLDADGAAILLQASNGGLPGEILGATIVKLK